MIKAKLDDYIKITDGLTEIQTKEYLIPDFIICGNDKATMGYNEYLKGYSCSCCKNFVSAINYVKLEKQKAQQQSANAASNRQNGSIPPTFSR